MDFMAALDKVKLESMKVLLCAKPKPTTVITTTTSSSTTTSEVCFEDDKVNSKEALTDRTASMTADDGSDGYILEESIKDGKCTLYMFSLIIINKNDSCYYYHSSRRFGNHMINYWCCWNYYTHLLLLLVIHFFAVAAILNVKYIEMNISKLYGRVILTLLQLKFMWCDIVCKTPLTQVAYVICTSVAYDLTAKSSEMTFFSHTCIMLLLHY